MIFFRLQGFLSSGKNYTLIGGKALINKYFTTWRWKLQFVTLTLISSSSFLTKITWSQSCLHKNLTFALSLFLGNCNPVDYPRIHWHQFPQKCQKLFLPAHCCWLFEGFLRLPNTREESTGQISMQFLSVRNSISRNRKCLKVL